MTAVTDFAAPSPERVWIRVAAGALGAGAALWLLSPILGAGHLEEITANLKMLAISANRGDVMGNDFLSPLVTEYHYATRLGVVLLLQAIQGDFGETGDVGFHGLMIVSFAVAFTASIVIARRWSRTGAIAAVAALALTPGIFETAFFFNDNLISAAFALGALAVVSRWRGSLAHALAGAALAFAILTRADAALAAPLLVGFVWLDDPRLAAMTRRGLATCAGGLAALAAAILTTHVSPLDTLALAKIFLPPSSLGVRAEVALYFFGFPTLALLALGAPSWRDPTASHWRIVFVIYPLLVVAIAVLKLSSEGRYVYPLLAPIIAIHGGAGLERLAAALSRRDRKALALAAALALCLALPPKGVVFYDGPRILVGRLWSPLLWRRWQITQDQSMTRVRDLVAEIDAKPTALVLAGHYNDEFFLKLRLLEDGYRPHPVSDYFPDCRDGFAVYAKPGHVVAHIRTDNQYGLVASPHSAVRAVQILRALDCAALWRADLMAFTAVGTSSWGGSPDAALFAPLLARLTPADAFSQTLAVPFALLLQPGAVAPLNPDSRLHDLVGEIETVAMSPTDLAVVKEAAAKVAATSSLDYRTVEKTYRGILAR